MICSNVQRVNTTAALPSRFIVVEDDAIFAAELCLLINQEAEFVLAGCARSFQEGVDLLRVEHDVLIADIGLPDGSGIDLIRQQQKTAPAVKSVVMTVFDDRETVCEALAAGADGYLVKTDPDILSRLLQITRGQHPLDPAVTGFLLEAVRCQIRSEGACQVVGLTPREQQTLNALSQGLTYREIAKHLQVSPHTVTDYIKGVYRKLEVNSRSEAVYAGVCMGLVTFN